MSEVLLALEDVSVRFGAQRALECVGLELSTGELLLLLGTNGAGKSTLLRVCGGLLRPAKGQALWQGQALSQAGNEVRREVGWVAQEHRCYLALTVAENLLLHARLYGLPEPRAATQRAMEWAGLCRQANQRAQSCSRGMIRRIELARLRLHRPRLLLLDEPYAGLDTCGAALVDDLLEAQIQAGGAALLATHQLASRSCALARRVMVLRRGKVVYDDHAPQAWTPAACAQLLTQLSEGNTQ